MRPTLLKLSLFLLAVPFTTPLGRGQEGRAFEIADYYRTAFVGAPEVSPDGTRVAFPVRRYDLAEDLMREANWREVSYE